MNVRKPFNSQRLNLRSISTDKAKLQQNININSITNDTSAFTHSSKKYFSPGAIGNQNYTEDLSKFRMGLLSAGSTSNNNIIIPMIGQLWNNFENNNKNMIDKAAMNDEDKNKKINNNLKKEENEIILDAESNKNIINMNSNNSNKGYDMYNKPNNINNNGVTKNKNLKSQDMKKQYNAFPGKNDINGVYIGMDKMITKLHKIKIEKGMMNTGIVNSLNKNFNHDYQNQIEQFKKSHLPMMFNSQANNNMINLSNNDKNKSIRNQRFNGKNNF